MRKKKKKLMKKIYIIFGIIFAIFILYKKIFKTNNNYLPINNIDTNVKEQINYNDYYNDYVKINIDKPIYVLENNEFKEFGKVYQDTILNLEKDSYLENGYFKIKDSDYYITYDNISKTEENVKDLFWKNYVPYNESFKTKEKTNFYFNDQIILTLNTEFTLPIIIKEENYYGVTYKDTLYYVKKEEGEVIKNTNTELKHTNAISTLVYHATYDNDNLEEKNSCTTIICLSNIQFENQMKYLKDNDFYTATMKDLEMFIDGKIQLPERTVVITIDDGTYTDSAIKILEKYNLHATLFLIGIFGSPDNYKSNNLEIHSHTWNMHTGGMCSGGQGSEIKCLPKEQILEDLQKSRESLNNTTYFCWPFFEYNDYAINILKEAGFTMAFAGGRQKIKVGSYKMTLPRYGIINTTTLDDFIKIIY